MSRSRLRLEALSQRSCIWPRASSGIYLHGLRNSSPGTSSAESGTRQWLTAPVHNKQRSAKGNEWSHPTRARVPSVFLKEKPRGWAFCRAIMSATAIAAGLQRGEGRSHLGATSTKNRYRSGPPGGLLESPLTPRGQT
eukprot:8960540-Pyramimonas_sp.AAC.1